MTPGPGYSRVDQDGLCGGGYGLGMDNTYRYLVNIGCKCQIEEGNVLMEGGRVAILMVLSELNNIVSPGIYQGLRTGEEIKPESRFQEAAQTDHILSRGKLGVVGLILVVFNTYY